MNCWIIYFYCLMVIGSETIGHCIAVEISIDGRIMQPVPPSPNSNDRNHVDNDHPHPPSPNDPRQLAITLTPPIEPLIKLSTLFFLPQPPTTKTPTSTPKPSLTSKPSAITVTPPTVSVTKPSTPFFLTPPPTTKTPTSTPKPTLTSKPSAITATSPTVPVAKLSTLFLLPPPPTTKTPTSTPQTTLTSKPSATSKPSTITVTPPTAPVIKLITLFSLPPPPTTKTPTSTPKPTPTSKPSVITITPSTVPVTKLSTLIFLTPPSTSKTPTSTPKPTLTSKPAAIIVTPPTVPVTKLSTLFLFPPPPTTKTPTSTPKTTLTSKPSVITITPPTVPVIKLITLFPLPLPPTTKTPTSTPKTTLTSKPTPVLTTTFSRITTRSSSSAMNHPTPTPTWLQNGHDIDDPHSYDHCTSYSRNATMVRQCKLEELDVWQDWVKQTCKCRYFYRKDVTIPPHYTRSTKHTRKPTTHRPTKATPFTRTTLHPRNATITGHHTTMDPLDHYDNCTDTKMNVTHIRECNLVHIEINKDTVKVLCKCNLYLRRRRVTGTTAKPTTKVHTRTTAHWTVHASTIKRWQPNFNLTGIRSPRRSSTSRHPMSYTTSSAHSQTVPGHVQITTTPTPPRMTKSTPPIGVVPPNTHTAVPVSQGDHSGGGHSLIWKILTIATLVILLILAAIIIRQYCCHGRSFNSGFLRESWRSKAISAWMPNVFIERAEIRCAQQQQQSVDDQSAAAAEQVRQQVRRLSMTIGSEHIAPPSYPSIYPRLEISPQTASTAPAASSTPKHVDTPIIDTVPPLWTTNQCQRRSSILATEDPLGIPVIPHPPMEDQSANHRARTARFARGVEEQQRENRMVQVKPAQLFPTVPQRVPILNAADAPFMPYPLLEVHSMPRLSTASSDRTNSNIDRNPIPLHRNLSGNQLPPLKHMEAAAFPSVFDRFKNYDGDSRTDSLDGISLSRSPLPPPGNMTKLTGRRCVSRVGRSKTQGQLMGFDPNNENTNEPLEENNSPLSNVEPFPNRRQQKDWQYRNQTPTHWNIRSDGETKDSIDS